MKDLETRIAQIEERNKRVEAEKAWETSVVRRVSIVLLTYLIMIILFYSIGSQDPMRNAIVPTLGYLLSTLSLEWIRKIWIDRRKA